MPNTERKPATAEGKKLFTYIKAYIDVKGKDAEVNFKKWKSPHFEFAKTLDSTLGSVDLFKEMLNTFGAFLTSKGKTGWNMKTMADRSSAWLERKQAFDKKNQKVTEDIPF